MTLLAVNARNQFRGTILEIVEGPVVSEIDVRVAADVVVTSVVTTRSVHELRLRVGGEVIALVKATDVSLASL